MWDHGLTDPSILLHSSSDSDRIRRRKEAIAENFRNFRKIMISNRKHTWLSSLI
jgi:hypothetical protein